MTCFADGGTALRCILAPCAAFIHGRASRPWSSLCNGRREAEYPHRVRRFPKPSRLSNPAHYDRLGIFVGFAAFFFMEKTLRVLGGDGEGAGHSHTHSHPHPHDTSDRAETTALEVSRPENGLRSRKTEKAEEASPEPAKVSSGPSKLSAYLNLFGDFVHNMCVDGVLV